MNRRQEILKAIAVVALGSVAFSARAAFEISVDPAKPPIRDASKTPCASLIGYAGSMNSEKMGHIYDNDAYWFASNRYETAAVMKEAGAYNQRLWSANVWFARRHPVTQAEWDAVEEHNRKTRDWRKRRRHRTQSVVFPLRPIPKAK